MCLKGVTPNQHSHFNEENEDQPGSLSVFLFFGGDMGPRCYPWWPLQSQAASLKRHLAPQLGVSRFRLRLLREGSECLADQEPLELPLTLQLVILGFAPNEVQGQGRSHVPVLGECATANMGSLEERGYRM